MKNPIYEQALTKQGVEWEVLDKVPLLEINTHKGLSNQARLETPLDEDLVARYEAGYRAQDKFPPLVLWRPGRGKYVPIDGNQRLEACRRANYKYHDAYLVKCDDPKVIDRLTWGFNNLVNGKRLRPEESLEHAVSYCRKYGATVKESAEEFGVSAGKVRERLAQMEVQDALDRQKVKRGPTLDGSVMSKLSPLLKVGEDVLALAARAVAEAGLRQDDVEEIVTAVGKAPTHDKKVEAVVEYTRGERFRRRKAETKGGMTKSVPRPAEELARLVRRINYLFDKYPDRAALKPVGAEWKKMRTETDDCCEHLCILFGLGTHTKVGQPAGGEVG